MYVMCPELKATKWGHVGHEKGRKNKNQKKPMTPS
jgi:hypothetical protein